MIKPYQSTTAASTFIYSISLATVCWLTLQYPSELNLPFEWTWTYPRQALLYAMTTFGDWADFAEKAWMVCVILVMFTAAIAALVSVYFFFADIIGLPSPEHWRAKPPGPTPFEEQRAEIKALKADLLSLRETTGEQASQVQQLTQINDRLQKADADATQNATALRQEIIRHSIEAEKLQQKLAATKASKDELEMAAIKCERALTQLQTEAGIARAEIEALQAANAQLTAELTATYGKDEQGYTKFPDNPLRNLMMAPSLTGSSQHHDADHQSIAAATAPHAHRETELAKAPSQTPGSTGPYLFPVRPNPTSYATLLQEPPEEEPNHQDVEARQSTDPDITAHHVQDLLPSSEHNGLRQAEPHVTASDNTIQERLEVPPASPKTEPELPAEIVDVQRPVAQSASTFSMTFSTIANPTEHSRRMHGLDPDECSTTAPLAAAAPEATPVQTPHSDAQVVEDFIVVFPLDTHELQSSNHMRNFIKYLFSQSKNHPQNEDTEKNAIIEGNPVDPSQVYWNAEPRKLSKAFLDSHPFLMNNYEGFLDDGAYVSFIIHVGGRSFSNLLTAKTVNGEANINVIEQDFAQDIIANFDGKHTLPEVVAPFLEHSQAIEWWDKADPDSRMVIERRLHHATQNIMGGNTYISVSHNDQRDHNQIYHIHRIRDREAGEKAEISQEEVDLRAKQWQTD